MNDIFFWLVEYWYIIAVCGVIVYLLINKDTRKMTLLYVKGLRK